MVLANLTYATCLLLCSSKGLGSTLEGVGSSFGDLGCQHLVLYPTVPVQFGYYLPTTPCIYTHSNSKCVYVCVCVCVCVRVCVCVCLARWNGKLP